MSGDIVVAPGKVEGQLDFASIFEWAPGISRPVELEIGCGKGKFLLAAARKWPDRDFLAVEQARALVRKVRDKVAREGLPNVRLYHGNAKDLLSRLVPEASLARIHVYFPDPWPKRRHAKHRLFAGEMPDAVLRALVPGGELLLATDHDPYFRDAVSALGRPGFVGVLPDAFDELPRGGFDAIFEAAGVPIFRAAWQRER